jgi:hypothetical protein
MKVENPKFSHTGEVYCEDCPWHILNGSFSCLEKDCPIAETYAEACTLADKAIAAKEGR